MPIPSAIKQKMQQKRLERITELAMAGYYQAKDCFDEVFCGSIPLIISGPIMKFAMRDYVLNLEANNIELKQGQIEPHAMYLRTFFIRKFRELEVLKNCIQPPIPMPDGSLLVNLHDVSPGKVITQSFGATSYEIPKNGDQRNRLNPSEDKA